MTTGKGQTAFLEALEGALRSAQTAIGKRLSGLTLQTGLAKSSNAPSSWQQNMPSCPKPGTLSGMNTNTTVVKEAQPARSR